MKKSIGLFLSIVLVLQFFVVFSYADNADRRADIDLDGNVRGVFTAAEDRYLVLVSDEKQNLLYGLIDEDGKFVIKPEYKMLTAYYNGVAVGFIEYGKDKDTKLEELLASRAVLLDKNGKELTTKKYNYIKPFYSWPWSEYDENKTEIIDYSDYNKTTLYGFSDVTWALRFDKDKKPFFDLIDKSGKIILEDKSYAYATPFYRGISIVASGGEYLLKEDGTELNKKKYETIKDGGEGLFIVADLDTGKSGFMDYDANEKTNLEYSDAKPFKNGMAAVKKNGDWALIDRNFELVSDYEYDEITRAYGGLIYAKKGEYTYILNSLGHTINKFKDRNIVEIKKDIVVFSEWRKGGEGFGVLDWKGNVIVPADNGNLFWVGNNYLFSMKSSEIGVFEQNLKPVIPYQKDFIPAPFDSDTTSVGKFLFGKNAFEDKSNRIAALADADGSLLSEFDINDMFILNGSKAAVTRNNRAYVMDFAGHNLADLGEAKLMVPLWNDAVCLIDNANKFRVARDLQKVSTKKAPEFKLTGASTWARKELTEAKLKYIVPAHLQRNFGDEITRAEFAELIVNMIASSKKMSVDYFAESVGAFRQSYFRDTMQVGVLVAKNLGIVNGKTELLFDPKGKITREEAAKMLSVSAKYLKKHADKSEASEFRDDNISEWAKPYIDDVSSLGIMKGTSDTLFDPKGGYTREQAILTVLRLYKMK